jgi:alpha-1,4-galacturonosyltransferase
MTDDEAHFHMKQSAFLYNLGAQTLPKTHHCFSMRLTLEYFKSPSLDSDVSLARKFKTPNHRHYVILSKNVLAASVVINSSVGSSKVRQLFTLMQIEHLLGLGLLIFLLVFCRRQGM